MDRALEQRVTKALNDCIGEKNTLFLVTHKPEMLSLVDRIMVVANQKVVLDGPKESVLAQLAGNN